MKLDVAGITDRGLNPKRQHNEDAYLVSGNNLFVLADGLGGEKAGEVASRMTVELTVEFITKAAREVRPSLQQEIQIVANGIRHANRIAHREARKPEFMNMGSTVVALYLVGDSAITAHVGDSRIYRIREGETVRLTTDHGLVQQLVDNNIISEAQARVHPMRNLLYRCIAQAEDVEVETDANPVQENDVFVLCSDGVTEYVGDDDLADLASSDLSAEEICAEIKEMCYAGGASDNLTAIVVRIVDK